MIFVRWREYAEKIYELRVDLHDALLNIADAIVSAWSGVSGRKKQVPFGCGGNAIARHPNSRQKEAPEDVRGRKRVGHHVMGERSKRAGLPSQKPATRK